MRNWNYCSPWTQEPSEWLPDYLWGIETTSKNTILPARAALPDYLWGIETRQGSTSQGRTYCFQTTYEELKHTFSMRHGVESSSFQTTYEELKRRYTRDAIQEERDQASRLPMRNWNSRTSRLSCRFREVGLPDYLWGIETETARMRYYSGRRLPDYLWGIETVVCQTDWKVD